MLQKVQLTSLHFHPGHPKNLIMNFDLFIIWRHTRSRNAS